MTSALIRATTALKPLSVLIPRQQKARTFRRGDMAPRKHPSKSLPSGARFRRALHHRVVRIRQRPLVGSLWADS